MGRLWVLDTETKGTGAEMVPLEKVQRPPGGAGDPGPAFVPSGRRAPRAAPPPAKVPRRFKAVDVMTGETLGEDLTGRALVDLLKGVRSVVDVRLSAWEPEEGRWRLLTLREQRAIWALRDR